MSLNWTAPRLARMGTLGARGFMLKWVKELGVLDKHPHGAKTHGNTKRLRGARKLLVGLEAPRGPSCHAGNKEGKLDVIAQEVNAGVELGFVQLRQGDVDEPYAAESAAFSFNGVSGRVGADRQVPRFP